MEIGYRAVEIWTADWHVRYKDFDYLFDNEVTIKVPLKFLLKDDRFMKRIYNRINPSKKKDDGKSKPVIKITYIKKIGYVN